MDITQSSKCNGTLCDEVTALYYLLPLWLILRLYNSETYSAKAYTICTYGYMLSVTCTYMLYFCKESESPI